MANSKDPAHVETDEILKRLEKKLKTTYNQAYRKAADKFTSYMAAFERKDASHRADVASGKWTKEQYESWRRNQLLYGDTLKDIRDTIAADLHNTNKMAINLVREKQKDVYALNHNYGTYEIEKGTGVSTSYTLYDHDTVERLMRDDPELLPKPSPKRQKEIDAKDLKWNKQKLSSVFTASILSGDDIPTMATRIASVAQMDRNAAIRNARTMSTGAENAGRTDSYKRAVAMGIDVEQEWMATLDGRTRDSHRQLDGEKVKVGKLFSNGLRFPADPEGAASEVYNCRCTLVAVVGGIDPSLFDKESVLKKDSTVANMTYEQWAHHKSTLQIKQEQDAKKAEEKRKASAERYKMTKELEKALKAYSNKFDDGAPTYMLLEMYSEEKLIKLLNQCVEDGEDVYDKGILTLDSDVEY